MQSLKLSYHNFIPEWKRCLEQGLADDRFTYDWTTAGCLGQQSKKLKANIVCKSPGVWACDGLLHVMSDLAKDLGSEIKIQSHVRDGQYLEKKSIACEWQGEARTILILERTFLNIASYINGIATQTRQAVEKVSGLSSTVRISSTRKILPGYRDLAIYGVMAGGGYSHRRDLASGVLIKENHIASVGGVEQSIRSVRQLAPHGLKVEIEVRNLEELKSALNAGADAVLLDNFIPATVAQAIQLIRDSKKSVIVEVSGGINLENIHEYALEGVNVISMGSLTHSVQAMDLSLLIL